jgi:hypothetical protein
MDGAVASGRDNLFEAFLHRMPRQGFGFARRRRRANRAPFRQRFHPGPPAVRSLAARGGIQNDNGIIHKGECAESGFDLFFKLGLRNVWA